MQEKEATCHCGRSTIEKGYDMTDVFVWAVVRVQNGYARLRDEERAQTLTEYALIIAVVALGVIIAIVFLRDQIRSLFNRAGSELSTQPGP